MDIAFSKASFGSEEDEAILRVIHNPNMGQVEVTLFEEEFKAYVGAKYAIFTNSCTSALKLAYKWAKQQDYDYIYYPDNTFCATYSAAKEVGLQTNAYTVGEDPDWLSGFRVNMHYGGIKDETPCLIEDSAHRIEAEDPLVGKIRCYSFHEQKNMACGLRSSGGMFVTNDKAIYDWAKLQIADGRTWPAPAGYKVVTMAGGYEGNALSAAIGRVQLKRLPQFNQRRAEIVMAYNQALDQDWGGTHLYPYHVKSIDEIVSLRAYLKGNGIETSYHYPQNGGNYRPDWLTVSLPLYPSLTDGEVAYIIEQVNIWR